GEAGAAEEGAEEGEGGGEGEGEDGRGGQAKGRPGGRRGRRPPDPPEAAAVTVGGNVRPGQEGYGLWLDPEVADSPVYAEHWAGHRPVEVTIEEDQIVIRRAGEDAGDDDDDD